MNELIKGMNLQKYRPFWRFPDGDQGITNYY